MDVKTVDKPVKVLWLSPNLNHYKAAFLDLLNRYPEIELSVLYGSGRKGKGDIDRQQDVSFEKYFIDADKAKFGFSKKVRKKLKRLFPQFDWVLIPREKKNLVLILYAFWLRATTKNHHGNRIRLISYNHPVLKTKGKTSLFDNLLTLFFYRFYDRIIFYTRNSCEDAVRKGLIKKEKAFWANNTINTKAVDKYYDFCYPDPSYTVMLFIGRLIPIKKVTVFLEYYFELKKALAPKNKTLKAVIIGDGPERTIVEEAIRQDPTIQWPGALVDEKEISPYMKKAGFVFVPGHSGLSVNHAFAYGRPYFTIEGRSHAPEIAYIQNGKNGYIMGKNKTENLRLMHSFLVSKNKEMYDNARMQGEQLSIDNWCVKMIENFTA